MSDILLIGSCEPFSGKSALVLGIAKRLLQEKKKVRIGKPLATCIELTNLPSMSYEGLIDDDVKFIGSTLNIEEEIHWLNPLFSLHLIQHPPAIS